MATKDAYINLNIAIWKLALDDEYKQQKVRLFEDVTEKVFNVLLKYPKEKRNTFAKVERIVYQSYGAEWVNLVRELEIIIDEHYKKIKKAVQHKIYRESIAWPDNIKHKKDPEYEKEYLQIRDSILKAFYAVNAKEA